MKPVIKPSFVFYSVLFLNVAFIFIYKYIPTLDGPQHLYNSNVILEILKGNNSFTTFFKLNNVLVGNSIGQYLLAFFNWFLPAFVAEKLLFLIYFLFVPISFRYLIITITKKDNLLTLLIFPYCHTMLLYFGYYNFSLATILYFLILAQWVKYEYRFNTKALLILASLLVLQFFSHIMVLGITGITLGLYIVYGSIIELSLKKKAESLKYLLKNSLKLIIVSLPSLIISYLYLSQTSGIGSTVKNTIHLRAAVIKLFELRSLIAFSENNEAPILFIVSIVTIAILSIGVYETVNHFSAKNDYMSLFQKNQFWLWLFVVFLIAYLVIPNKLGVGAIKTRLNVFMFYILLIWLNTINFPNRLKEVSMFFVLIAFGLQIKTKHIFLHNANKKAVQITDLEEHIDNNSTLYPINLSKCYTEFHYDCYLGINKKIINLRNPQCHGPFPVVFTNGIKPKVSLKPIDKKLKTEPDNQLVNPDYVFVWAGTVKALDQLKKEKPNEYALLNLYYSEIKSTQNGQGILFKLN